tara:strand:+ start:15 stop:365 length:351 start_codon:yes stop_codon:yes gene_type:complete
MSNTMKLDDDLLLTVKGLGHVPSLKNRKRIARGRLITDPKVQKWMANCVSSFVSQLRSNFQTTDDATSTGDWLRSSIASLPADDNWKILPQIQVQAEKVDKGDEGAVILLEKISPV